MRNSKDQSPGALQQKNVGFVNAFLKDFKRNITRSCPDHFVVRFVKEPLKDFKRRMTRSCPDHFGLDL